MMHHKVDSVFFYSMNWFNLVFNSVLREGFVTQIGTLEFFSFTNSLKWHLISVFRLKDAVHKVSFPSCTVCMCHFKFLWVFLLNLEWQVGDWVVYPSWMVSIWCFKSGFSSEMCTTFCTLCLYPIICNFNKSLCICILTEIRKTDKTSRNLV